jgi:hypothetical protein
LLREFGLLLGGDRFNAARVDCLANDRFELVRQEVPYFDVRYGIVYEIQIAEGLQREKTAA